MTNTNDAQNVGLVRSPLQNPISSPVCPIHSLTPFTAAFAIPALVPVLPLLGPDNPPRPSMPAPLAPSGMAPGLMKLLPSPVAYSDPIDGSTFSPADSDTNKLKGTNHTQSPKKDEISVKEGRVGVL